MKSPISFRRAIPALLVVSFVSLACGTGGGYQTVTVRELKSVLDKNPGTIVLDVRTPEELAGELGRLDPVLNIPVQELDGRLAELEQYKDKSIYVICRSGNRSRTASDILARNGYTAFNVAGGMREWRTVFGAAAR